MGPGLSSASDAYPGTPRSLRQQRRSFVSAVFILKRAHFLLHVAHGLLEVFRHVGVVQDGVQTASGGGSGSGGGGSILHFQMDCVFAGVVSAGVGSFLRRRIAGLA